MVDHFASISFTSNYDLQFQFHKTATELKDINFSSPFHSLLYNIYISLSEVEFYAFNLSSASRYDNIYPAAIHKLRNNILSIMDSN